MYPFVLGFEFEGGMTEGHMGRKPQMKQKAMQVVVYHLCYNIQTTLIEVGSGFTQLELNASN